MFIVGLVAVVKGGDWLVEAAVWFSQALGISKVIIGATVVSLGTTLPEVMISSFAAYQGKGDIVIGTALGSIIFNSGIILGLSLLIKPIVVKERDSFYKVAIMIGAVILLGLFGSNGYIGRFESSILLSLLASYIGINIWATTNNNNGQTKLKFKPKELSKKIGQFLIGLIFIVVGAKILLDSGVAIARIFGLSEALIAVTLFAIGSSLPELVTSITAASKGHSDLLLGNILGANTLNVFCVVAVSGFIRPLSIDASILLSQIPVALIIIAVLVVPAFFTRKITRIQGIIASLLYIGFVITTTLG